MRTSVRIFFICMKIVIAGGGSAGWMSAAYLSKHLPPEHFDISLIESSEIGTVGVGEATLPHLRAFNHSLGIDETEFVRETNATIKLGIAFDDWSSAGRSYLHPFGQQGRTISDIPFHQLYEHARNCLDEWVLPAFDEFSYGVQLARAEDFHKPAASGIAEKTIKGCKILLNCNTSTAKMPIWARINIIPRLPNVACCSSYSPPTT